ncbi:hypothetical protein T11_18501 [Trichinella zimbabwensis]|uniref:Uncharacterized protein n=1 Tax=Trichinella zimbabwensis TaxID=268475 RepID=A0A0V1HT18_9BILA|nr:hypothetical protein T11_18501 [Trichinella zimbabwensis]
MLFLCVRHSRARLGILQLFSYANVKNSSSKNMIVAFKKLSLLLNSLLKWYDKIVDIFVKIELEERCILFSLKSNLLWFHFFTKTYNKKNTVENVYDFIENEKKRFRLSRQIHFTVKSRVTSRHLENYTDFGEICNKLYVKSIENFVRIVVLLDCGIESFFYFASFLRISEENCKQKTISYDKHNTIKKYSTTTINKAEHNVEKSLQSILRYILNYFLLWWNSFMMMMVLLNQHAWLVMWRVSSVRFPALPCRDRVVESTNYQIKVLCSHSQQIANKKLFINKLQENL